MQHIDSMQPPARRRQLLRPRRPGKPLTPGARFTAFTRTKRRRLAWGVLATVVLSPLLFVFALLGLAGIGAVAVYGIAALVLRWPSRASFILALAALAYMIILQLAAAAAAQTMAVLAYILLAIGAISLVIEVKMGSRVWFKKH